MDRASGLALASTNPDWEKEPYSTLLTNIFALDIFIAYFGTPDLIRVHLCFNSVDSLTLSSRVMSGFTAIGDLTAHLLDRTLKLPQFGQTSLG